MKKTFLILMCIFTFFLATGCQSNKTRVAEGTVAGGLLGATAGGIIGQQSHHGAEGAGIGVAAGALMGAIIGSQIEKPGQPQAVQSATINPNQMSIQQIAELKKQGINEDVIIDKIRLTNSRFSLNADDINYLKQQGVSQKVIDAMQQGM